MLQNKLKPAEELKPEPSDEPQKQEELPEVKEPQAAPTKESKPAASQ